MGLASGCSADIAARVFVALEVLGVIEASAGSDAAASVAAAVAMGGAGGAAAGFCPSREQAASATASTAVAAVSRSVRIILIGIYRS